MYNKKDLVKAVATATDFTQKDVAVVVDSVLDTITATLAKEEEVSLTGFGKFVAVKKEARDMKNPLTGEMIHVDAKLAPKFKPSTTLKAALND